MSSNKTFQGFKDLVNGVISQIPFSVSSRFCRVDVAIPYYHIISDDDVLHIKHLYRYKSVKQFFSDIDFIARHMNVVDLLTLLSHLDQRDTLPSHALLLTFDDGFSEMYDIVAPILKKKGIPAVFFVNSAFVDNQILCYQHKASLLAEHILQRPVSRAEQIRIEDLLYQNNINTGSLTSAILSIKYHKRDLIDCIADFLDVDFRAYLLRRRPYLTSSQICELIDSGFAVGAHSVDHPLYADISLMEQVRQTKESVAFVKNRFSLDYSVFAFPHSDSGVTREYYRRISTQQVVDMHFGTAGTMEDSVTRSLQRFSMEKPMLPAKDILSLQFTKRLWRTARGNNRIAR